MNRYGLLAFEHWRVHRSDELSRMTDRESFFARLGEQISYQVAELTRELRQGGAPDEAYLTKASRFRRAREQAEEQILRHALTAPTSTPA
jgi:hypothetical protein